MLALAFSYEAVLESIVRVNTSSLPSAWASVLLGINLVLLTAGLLLLRRYGQGLAWLSRGLTLVAMILLIFALGELVWFAWRSEAQPNHDVATIHGGQAARSVGLRKPQAPLRDIYLIVLDAYAREDVLRQVYGYDNAGFLNSLRAEGFQVADGAFSNYLSTKLTLPSLLNMRYLDYLTKQYGPNYPNVMPLMRDIQHNIVVSSLRDLGYRIVNITSDVSYASLADPDEVIAWSGDSGTLNALETVLVDMTPMRLWRANRSTSNASEPEERRRRHLHFNLQQLAHQGKAEGPKFVYVHIMAPHNPFVFDRQGEPTASDFRMFHEYEAPQAAAIGKAYTDQVHYLNGQVLSSIKKILADSKVEPIIAVMGDHGLRLHLRERAGDSCLQESFAILYALHLPGQNAPVLAPVASPVNTFRMIFDTYFATRLGRLSDRAFFAHRKISYYAYPDVTENVESCDAKGVPTVGIRHPNHLNTSR